jgi:hypothetical protein
MESERAEIVILTSSKVVARLPNGHRHSSRSNRPANYSVLASMTSTDLFANCRSVVSVGRVIRIDAPEAVLEAKIEEVCFFKVLINYLVSISEANWGAQGTTIVE